MLYVLEPGSPMEFGAVLSLYLLNLPGGPFRGIGPVQLTPLQPKNVPGPKMVWLSLTIPAGLSNPAPRGPCLGLC